MNISPVDLVLRVSAKSLGACELPANSNAGPYVERVLQRVGLKKGDPWCAAEVYDTGATALGEDVWPLPKAGSCQLLYEWAVKHKCVAKTPSRGDVFLIWHPELKRFGHTGFVVDVPSSGPCVTHEGNTSGGGSREGWLKARRERVFKPEDRFIQWTAKIPQDE